MKKTPPCKFQDWPARIRFTYKRRFRAVYGQHKERGGQKFTVVRAVTRPEQRVGAAVGPMVIIQFEDGAMLYAWPEEVVATINGERLRVRV